MGYAGPYIKALKEAHFRTPVGSIYSSFGGPTLLYIHIVYIKIKYINDYIMINFTFRIS